MRFTFSENKAIFNGAIRDYSYQNNLVVYEDIDIQSPLNNIITINNVDYIFTYMNGASPGNKGGNSIILRLYEAQSIDVDNIEYGDPDLILKISKFKKAPKIEWANKSEKRFNKEVTALKDCERKDFQNVIKTYHYGVCIVKNCETNKIEHHLFYTMEYAKYDLKSYIETKADVLSLYEKLSLCISLCEGLKELNSIGYYHRDIKPDNIFMVGDQWKIGDLGLIQERKKNTSIDEIAEFIGPRGWLSPEAMNKHLCEGKNFRYNHDCDIDHQSDIFQLGKVFWYIFQHNVPIGAVKEKDFNIKNSQIYSVIKTMLRYSKKSRYKQVDEIIKLFKIIEAKLLKKAA